MEMKVFGIKNCDTMKKTFDFLELKGISYTFMDYKKQKPSLALLEQLSKKVGFSVLINTKGTTYKKMSEEQKQALGKENAALQLLVENPSMIKRPILSYPDGSLVIGFDPEQIQSKKNNHHP
jgi:Spx/MgsR family transcriptional regulator